MDSLEVWLAIYVSIYIFLQSPCFIVLGGIKILSHAIIFSFVSIFIIFFSFFNQDLAHSFCYCTPPVC